MGYSLTLCVLWWCPSVSLRFSQNVHWFAYRDVILKTIMLMHGDFTPPYSLFACVMNIGQCTGMERKLKTGIIKRFEAIQVKGIHNGLRFQGNNFCGRRKKILFPCLDARNIDLYAGIIKILTFPADVCMPLDPTYI